MKTTMMIAATLALSTSALADTAAKKAPVKKDDKAPAMVMPKPAKELADAAKGMIGNWKCTGKAVMDPGSGPQPFTGNDRMSADLDKFWVKGDFTMTMGKMKMKGVEYITFDPAQKKWFRFAMDNMGGSETASSSDMKSWTGEMRSMGMTMKTKTTFEMASPKEFKVSSDMSMDGKKWMSNAFEMTCKK